MVSYWQIFLVFAKIGAFTIGGGIPMIAAIKSELVERKWLKDEDFLEMKSVILLEQIRTIDKKRIDEKIGELSSEIMGRVDEAIKTSLDIK